MRSLYNNNLSLFDNLFEPTFSQTFNWKEENDYLKLEVDVPGIKKEDISIDIENNFLKIKAKRNFKENGTESHVNYSGSFLIPKNANIESLNAELELGVLKLSMKKNQVSIKQILIK